jgi:hypothetical protein
MKVGDKVKLTTMAYGEAIFDRKGKPVDMPGYKSTYVGVIEYIGPECPFPSAEVVRCSGGDVALKLNNGFRFYPQKIGKENTLEVLV